MNNLKYLFILIAGTLFFSCYEETLIEIPDTGDGLTDWTTSTHSGEAIPNYEIVFPQTKLNRFEITIASDDWSEMQSNLSSIYGSNQGGPGGGNFPDETPIYIPCNIEFHGTNWYNVGIRYKGNSSLKASSRGETKLPFRLDFDELEDEYPEIGNQTFYGFPALSMSSNYNDLSLMREKAANDLFLDFGVPAPHTSFYEMYIDYGDGPVYFGLYTGVEVVFETALSKQFGSDNGNCYKPEDVGASFSQSGFSLDDFENKTTGGTGEDDIQELFDILHSSTRLDSETEWKDQLETVFDVDGFLKWLAANTTIQNWDTYGLMTHNYYLYHDPADDLIKWIPWDNNEAFQKGKMGGALSFSFSELNTSSWPLIGYLIDIPEYEGKYKRYINDFIEGAFDPSKMENYYSNIQSLIQSSVEAETTNYSYLNSISDFSSAVNQLKSHAYTRKDAALSYVQ